MLFLCRARLAGFALLGAVVLVPGAAFAQSISLTGGMGPVENFDTLLNTPAGATSSTLPNGWYLAETGSSANTSYAVDDGTNMSGNTYSYGFAAGNAERALGLLQSGSNTPMIGAKLTNNTGAALSGLVVEFTGEQWRLGALGRSDRMDFQYSTDATTLNNGTWTNVDLLDFTAPTQGPTIGKLDGNAAANRASFSNTITGLSVANGGTIWVRWTDFNPSGADDGLAIDDVRFGTPGDFPPTVLSTVPAAGSNTAQPSTNITVNFSEPVSVGLGWFDVSCDQSNGHTAVVSGGPSTFTLNPDTDFITGESCTLTITAAAVADQDGTADNMAADARIGFTIAADAPPVIETTTPANNATGVASNVDITLKFSEAVATTGTWFTITCAVSGAHTAVADAGPSLYTINPDVDFGANEVCTVSVVAANVHDLDGTTQDAMPANYAFSFTTAAGDTAPTVIRTMPAEGNGSTPWSTDLSFFFSEAVTAPAGAFAISCASSGTHPFALSTSTNGQRVLLNPTTDFNANEACTVTITGAQVFDIDGTPNPLAANYVMHFTTQPLAANYYAGVDASSCSALRTTLHNKIKDHVAYMYSATSGLTTATATWNILEDADEDVLNPNNVLDIYRNRSYVKVTARSGTTDASHYNREHTWPNSHGFNDTNGLDANGNAFSPYTDTHMLYASASDFNANRGNNPYGNCPGCTEDATDAYGGFGGPGHSNRNGANVYEVWDHRKGDAARAVLYMDVRYEGGNAANGQPEPDLIVTDNAAQIVNTTSGQIAAQGYMGLKTDMIGWASADPPDAAEQLRNDIIYGYQGNRNPFIDHPEWVACLFNCQCAPLPDDLFKNSFE